MVNPKNLAFNVGAVVLAVVIVVGVIYFRGSRREAERGVLFAQQEIRPTPTKELLPEVREESLPAIFPTPTSAPQALAEPPAPSTRYMELVQAQERQWHLQEFQRIARESMERRVRQARNWSEFKSSKDDCLKRLQEGLQKAQSLVANPKPGDSGSVAPEDFGEQLHQLQKTLMTSNTDVPVEFHFLRKEFDDLFSEYIDMLGFIAEGTSDDEETARMVERCNQLRTAIQEKFEALQTAPK